MNRKIRVLHVLNTGKYSGAENVAITIISSMKDVEFAYASLNGPIVEILKDNNILYYPIGEQKINIRKLKKAIVDFRPDIIQAHDFTSGIKTVMTCEGVPIINHIHCNVPWLQKICIKSLSFLLFSCFYKKIILVSDSIIDEYVFRKIINRKCIVVGNPIDTDKIKQKSYSEENKEESDVIFLGRMSEEKNPLLFIDIICQVAKRIPDIKAVMIGSGALEKIVEQKIIEKGLRENIQLYCFMQNPYGLMKNSKILCVPSSWEGFGLSAAEALALSKPVVAANVGGLKTIINESCGFLCDDISQYVDAIIELIENESCYQKKKQGAINRANELENLNEYIENIYSIYIVVLGRNSNVE